MDSESAMWYFRQNPGSFFVPKKRRVMIFCRLGFNGLEDYDRGKGENLY